MCIKKYLNTALAMLVALFLIISMYSCNDGNGGEITSPNDDSDVSESTGGKEESNENDTNEPGDGLSADKTYYQLTDKDGRVIRIPIGVPLSVAENGTISTASTEVKSASKRISLTSSKVALADEEAKKSIYVFSPLSVISLGYGNINHPSKDGYLYQPDGTPCSADGDHVLVVQCLDIDFNAVEPTDASAYYIYAYVLDYKTNPDGLMFSEIIEYSAKDDEVINYFTFSNLVFSTPHTDKQITTQTDPETGVTTKIYYKVEEITLRSPGLIRNIPLKECFCNPDWSVKYWYEYTYDSDYNLIMDVHYDHADRVICKKYYDDDGNVTAMYSYEYYDNGQIKTISEPDYYAFYDENGEIIESATRMESSPGNYIWYSTYDNPILGKSGRLERVHENDRLVKEIYYYGDSNIIWQIYFINANGQWDETRDYYEDGTLCMSVKYKYIDDMHHYEYSTVYTEDGTIESENEYYCEGVYPLTQKSKDYIDGVLTYIYYYEYYPENGGLKMNRCCDANDNLIVETYYDKNGNTIKEIYP